jgi:hypothetical protein
VVLLIEFDVNSNKYFDYMMVFIDDFIFNGIFGVDGILFDDSVVVDVIVIFEFVIVIVIDDILGIIID